MSRFESVTPLTIPSPLGAVADMVGALTRTITCLDRQPPEDLPKYQDIRTVLLNQSRNFLELTLDAKVPMWSSNNDLVYIMVQASDPTSVAFAKKAKEFVRQAR